MDWIKNRFPAFKKILAVCHTEKQSCKENNLQEIKYHLQLSFSMLSVIKLYLGKNRAFCIQFSAVPLCDAPVKSQPILMMTLSVAMATCLHAGTGHAKLRMGLLERSLWGLFSHWWYWKIANVGRKMTWEKKMELWAEVRTSKFISTEKALSNLLLIGLLHVVHAFKMREGIHLFFGNICFISETSKALNCLDNSTCQDGNSFEVLCSRPFPEPALGERSQEKQACLQAVPTFLLYRAARCQYGLFRCSNSHRLSALLQAGSARRMIPALTGHRGGGWLVRNSDTAAVCTQGACW